ncbi:YcaO-like family protein [Micromonospora sp. WMMA2032]|uniref:YcaO-like family protein n=1 Tax=Micromonospora sp. WMMA2032 TaxID=2039870 RepID=UPI0012FDE1E8|nr:YcaO-like family protein [Micromonospora sp. WMMA2032]
MTAPEAVDVAGAWRDVAATCDIVSVDERGASALLRHGARGWRLRSPDPAAVLTQARRLAGGAPVPGGEPREPTVPLPEHVLLDAPDDGWRLGRWWTADDLVTACRNAPAAAVPVAACAYRPAPWAAALAALAGAVPHQPVLVLGRWLVVGPVVRNGTDHRWLRSLLGQLDPQLSARIDGGHRLAHPAGRALPASVVSAVVAAREVDPDGVDIHLRDLRGGSRQRVRPPRSVRRAARTDPPDGPVFQPWVDHEEIDAAIPLTVALGAATDPVRPVRSAAVSPLAGLATARAALEAAERFALNRRPARTVTCAREDLPAGQSVVVPEPFTDAQRAAADFPHPAVDPRAPRPWTSATSLVDGRPCWVPTEVACLVPAVAGDRPCVPRTSTGTAAHTSALLAEQGGLLEVAERDLVARHWPAGRMHRLDPGVWARELDQVARQLGRDPYLYLCADPLASVCVVTLHDPDTGAAHVGGCAAAPTVAEAAAHAFEEALMLHHRGVPAGAPAPLAAPVVADPLNPAGVAAFEANFHFDRLRRHYRAVSVDLDTPGLRADGIVVRKVISPVAADLPVPGGPLPERLLDAAAIRGAGLLRLFQTG